MCHVEDATSQAANRQECGNSQAVGLQLATGLWCDALNILWKLNGCHIFADLTVRN